MLFKKEIKLMGIDKNKKTHRRAVKRLMKRWLKSASMAGELSLSALTPYSYHVIIERISHAESRERYFCRIQVNAGNWVWKAFASGISAKVALIGAQQAVRCNQVQKKHSIQLFPVSG